VKADPWIIVPNWRRFQHYKDRRPLWIKVYTELNSRDDWCDLTDAECGLLVRIWIEYARSGGRLKLSRLPSVVGQRSRRRQLQRLNHAGFIELSASPEVEIDKEKTSTFDSKEGNPKTLLDDLIHRVASGFREMPA
jgi:hypothetical protein